MTQYQTESHLACHSPNNHGFPGKGKLEEESEERREAARQRMPLWWQQKSRVGSKNEPKKKKVRLKDRLRKNPLRRYTRARAYSTHCGQLRTDTHPVINFVWRVRVFHYYCCFLNRCLVLNLYDEIQYTKTIWSAWKIYAMFQNKDHIYSGNHT